MVILAIILGICFFPFGLICTALILIATFCDGKTDSNAYVSLVLVMCSPIVCSLCGYMLGRTGDRAYDTLLCVSSTNNPFLQLVQTGTQHLRRRLNAAIPHLSLHSLSLNSPASSSPRRGTTHPHCPSASGTRCSHAAGSPAHCARAANPPTAGPTRSSP